MDMGGLETMVANSAYVSARGSVDGAAAATMRDKKYRAKLALPHIRQCEHMKTTVDSTFDSMCVRQPIGRRLFQQYLASDAAHRNAGEFWKDMEDYTVAQEKDRTQKAQKIVNKYFESSSKNFCSFLEEKAVSRVKEDLKNLRGDLFKESEQQLLKNLEDKALAGFKSSMYFLRYVQFKWLESQAVAEDWFMEFRVLGKGGFGEVSACQMKATGKMYANKKLNKKRLKKRKGYDVRMKRGSVTDALQQPKTPHKHSLHLRKRKRERVTETERDREKRPRERERGRWGGLAQSPESRVLGSSNHSVSASEQRGFQLHKSA